MARILVADDEPSICDAFAALLAADGHESVTAANGREAVQLVRNARPDVVFLDVRMPGLDGIAASKEIRGFDSAVPVIVMMVYGTLDTASERCATTRSIISASRSTSRRSASCCKGRCTRGPHRPHLPWLSIR